MKDIRSGLNSITMAIIPFAMVINMVVGQLVAWGKIPLYLDSLGTILVGMLAGPWAGALTGALSMAFWTLCTQSPIPAAFMPVAILVGWLAGIFSKWRWLNGWISICFFSFFTGLVCAAVSAPIAEHVFGGVTGGGGDILVAFFQVMTESVRKAVFLQSALSDSFDKPLSFIIIYTFLKGIPRRLLLQFPLGDRYLKDWEQKVVKGLAESSEIESKEI